MECGKGTDQSLPGLPRPKGCRGPSIVVVPPPPSMLPQPGPQGTPRVAPPAGGRAGLQPSAPYLRPAWRTARCA